MQCLVKARAFVTPEGPQVVVTEGAGPWAVASAAVAPGTYDWQPLSFEFTTPPRAGDLVLYVTVKRKPRFSYDDPTRGTVWFDNFALTEAQGTQ